jgi:hypothetical protein
MPVEVALPGCAELYVHALSRATATSLCPGLLLLSSRTAQVRAGTLASAATETLRCDKHGGTA